MVTYIKINVIMIQQCYLEVCPNPNPEPVDPVPKGPEELDV